MKALYRYFFTALMVVALISTPLTNLVQPVSAASAPCVDSTGPTGYIVTVCITNPAPEAVLAGNSTITATVTFTGTNPGVARMVFYLDSAYLLTDFQAPFTFTLPTNQWVDGAHTISAEADMKTDLFVTLRTDINVHFLTGTHTPPVNTNTFTPTQGSNPPAGQPFVVAAAGDGAGGELNAGMVTNVISAMNPNLFLYIGDVYEKGTYTEFFNWYNPTDFFGRFKSITDPTVGNHDYGTTTNAGYEFYWDNVPDFYSFNSHGWHFIDLNSYSVQHIDVTPSGAEYQWLQADLEANTSPCTLVYYHHPYLSIGQEGGRADLVDIWKLLAQHQVTLVINGHDHEYQRWVPLDGNAHPSAIGMTEFVIGTGGHSLETLQTTDNRVAFASASNPLAYGALKLQLNSSGAAFSYMSITGPTLDSGVIPCKGNATLHSSFLPLIFR